MNIQEWTFKVLHRDNFTCQKDGCQQTATDAHHIFKRRYKKVKYDIDNGISLCRDHHNWAEEDDKRFKKWYAQTFGQQTLDKLWGKAISKSQQFRKG